MSLLCAMAESTETTSSGVEVPMAITVRPTMNSGTRKRWASAAAPSVSKLAPARISPRPARSNKIFIPDQAVYFASINKLTAINAMPDTTP